ncbi:hypothetical protein MP228_009752 [Amoeboaphelidium protococcarum]|nr:hypothetical protein MP228_009752 [Amoeboaphelidium protococcarum]
MSMLSQVVRGSSSVSSLRKSNNQGSQTILDLPLNKNKNAEVSLGAMTFLLSEIVQYSQKRISGVPELERRLGEIGFRVGQKYSELLFYRERNGKRETKHLQMLLLVHTQMWKLLFGKPADSLERGADAEDEYMISDNDLSVTRFISVPKDYSSLCCGAFVAGIVEAVLYGANFKAKVTAHNTATKECPSKVTFLIKFESGVLEREVK